MLLLKEYIYSRNFKHIYLNLKNRDTYPFFSL